MSDMPIEEQIREGIECEFKAVMGDRLDLKAPTASVLINRLTIFMVKRLVTNSKPGPLYYDPPHAFSGD